MTVTTTAVPTVTAAAAAAATPSGGAADGGGAPAPAADSKGKSTKQSPHTYMGAEASVRYSSQVISPELNAAVLECVGELKRFQDRAYAKDPIKAKMRRRLVFGLREVAKAVQLKHAKAIVVAPNIEQTESEGGLDDVLGKIIEEARDNGTATVFALTRNRLGQIVGKRMRISALAILDHNGADDQFKAMIAAMRRGKEEFQKAKEKEKEKVAEMKEKQANEEKVKESAESLQGSETVGAGADGDDWDEGGGKLPNKKIQGATAAEAEAVAVAATTAAAAAAATVAATDTTSMNGGGGGRVHDAGTVHASSPTGAVSAASKATAKVRDGKKAKGTTQVQAVDADGLVSDCNDDNDVLPPRLNASAAMFVPRASGA